MKKAITIVILFECESMNKIQEPDKMSNQETLPLKTSVSNGTLSAC